MLGIYLLDLVDVSGFWFVNEMKWTGGKCSLYTRNY